MFEAKTWQTNLDLEIYNKNHGKMAFGKMHIYFLRSLPDVEEEDYGVGLADSGVFSGVKITINENIKRSEDANGVMQRAHEITGLFNIFGDEYKRPVKCLIPFERALIRIVSDVKAHNFKLEVKPKNADSWTTCFTIEQPVDFPTYFIMASSTESQTPNHHYVHSMGFWDTDGPPKKADKSDEEAVNTQQEDLLHSMNKDGELAHDSAKAISAYNDQLIAHNSRYAKLIGSVYRNQHLATEIMQAFPTQDFMNSLNNKITDFKALNNDFNKHFDKVHDTVANVVSELNKKPEDRKVDAEDFTLASEEAKVEQKLSPIHNQIAHLKQMISSGNAMGNMISNSSLQEQLNKFKRRQSEISIEQARNTHLRGGSPAKADIRHKFKQMLDSQVKAA